MSSELMRAAPADDAESLTRLAKYVVQSGLFGVANEAAAMVIIMTGRSLGLDPIVAMRGTHVVKGKAVLSSDAIAGIVRRSGECASWLVIKSTAEECTIETRRKGDDAAVRHTWTMEMAKRAKLHEKDIWKAYPHAMLRARCTAEIGRMVYPDILLGVYVEGEIPEEPRRAERATVTHDAPEVPALDAGPSPLDDFIQDCGNGEFRMVPDAWAMHSARLTKAGLIDDAKAHVVEWIASRLPVLASTEVQVLLSNAADVPRDFCTLYDRLAAAPTPDDALTAWRERGDMGGKWYAHTARQMTGRTLKSLGVALADVRAMLDDDGPDGGPGGGERAPQGEQVDSLSTVPARVAASNDATAVATLARLAAVQARAHLYRSACKHAAEILGNPLVREVYAHTARRIERVDTTDTRTPAELDAAARDLVTMWATTATAHSNDSSKAA
jgi:hypothetical protein